MQNKKRGFTLIELLVVVLIVGILAAVAVPQYTKAVERSRLAEVWSTMGTLRQALAVAMMTPETVTMGGISSYNPTNLDASITCTSTGADRCNVTCPSNKWSNCAYWTIDPQANHAPESSPTNPVVGFSGFFDGDNVTLYIDNDGRGCDMSSSSGSKKACSYLGVY